MSEKRRGDERRAETGGEEKEKKRKKEKREERKEKREREKARHPTSSSSIIFTGAGTNSCDGGSGRCLPSCNPPGVMREKGTARPYGLPGPPRP